MFRRKSTSFVVGFIHTKLQSSNLHYKEKVSHPDQQKSVLLYWYKERLSHLFASQTTVIRI